MPATAARRRLIHAPLEEAWALLERFEQLGDWARTVDHCTALTDPPRGPGAARRVQLGRITLVERVVTWAPPRELTYRIEGLPERLGHVENRWTLEPRGAHVSVTLTTTVAMGDRPIQRLVGRVVAWRLAHVSDQLLTEFEARLVEAGR